MEDDGSRERRNDYDDGQLFTSTTSSKHHEAASFVSHAEYTSEEWLMIRRRACQELLEKFDLNIEVTISFHGTKNDERNFMVGLHDGDYDSYSLFAAISPFKVFLKRTLRSLFPINNARSNVSIIEEGSVSEVIPTESSPIVHRQQMNSTPHRTDKEPSGVQSRSRNSGTRSNIRRVPVAQISVFGTPLSWSLRKCGVPHGPLSVSLPSPIKKSLEILEMSENRSTKNLFQKKGNKKVIKKLKALCEMEPTTSFVAKYIFEKEEIPTVHDVVGVLRMYLKELPESLFTQGLMPYFLKVEDVEDSKTQYELFQLLLILLPIENRYVLEALASFFHRIGCHDEHSEMYQSLPSITSMLLRKRRSGRKKKHSRGQNLVKLLIKEHSGLFCIPEEVLLYVNPDDDISIKRVDSGSQETIRVMNQQGIRRMMRESREGDLCEDNEQRSSLWERTCSSIELSARKSQQLLEIPIKRATGTETSPMNDTRDVITNPIYNDVKHMQSLHHDEQSENDQVDMNQHSSRSSLKSVSYSYYNSSILPEHVLIPKQQIFETKKSVDIMFSMNDYENMDPNPIAINLPKNCTQKDEMKPSLFRESPEIRRLDSSRENHSPMSFPLLHHDQHETIVVKVDNLERSNIVAPENNMTSNSKVIQSDRSVPYLRMEMGCQTDETLICPNCSKKLANKSSVSGQQEISNSNPVKYVSYQLLLNEVVRIRLDRLHLEMYLNDEEFARYMKCGRKEFYNLPEWRRIQRKKDTKLF